jgi:phenylpropionate dioxygenase-like ring-hydroxylating dioxygenase large terminal subunit
MTETPARATRLDYDKLIEEARVHGSLYYDQRVFEDELDRIWYREWIYVGHESEVPEPGDYHLKKIGLQPVIMTRDKEGQVHLLLNRCSHRANELCQSEWGNSSFFRCPYHGWTFKNNGDLTGAPYRSGYDGGLDKSELGLGRPARVSSYRGFVFGSMSPDGPDLDEHLGELGKEAIDRLCDLSPEGEVEISAGWMKHRTLANWKMMTENEVDGYHPLFVHKSLFEAMPIMMEEVFQDKGISKIRDYGNGHTEIDMRPEYRELGKKLAWFGAKESSVQGYVKAMEERYGEERAHEMLVDGPPHVMIFPNLFLAELNILNVQPVSVNETIQYQTPVFLKGAPEMNKRILRNTEGAMGPAGALIADDSEMYERNQRGLEARSPEWLVLRRGQHREERQDGQLVSHHTDETTQRAIWRHYKKQMVGA